MKTIGTMFALGFAAIAGLSGCGDDPAVASPDAEPAPDADPNVPDAEPGAMTIRLNDDITEDTTFEARHTYVIPRLKQLFVQPGVTLTIEPGTVIRGEQGSMLVITRGAQIHAEGTVDDPIVFTTSQADNAKTRGWWGGLLVLGAAPINNNTLSTPASNETTFEAFTSAIPEGKFGGDDAADNSGVIKYVRIEFAGYNFVSDREFNNLTLCGVGSATEIEYVQVHGGADDGLEIFGGTVNVKHIVITQNGDDGFDTDNGWQGKGQFIVVQNATPDGVREASNGMETDNHATAASYVATPRTLPTIYNMTMIGSPAATPTPTPTQHYAMILRRGTGGRFHNVLVTNYAGGIEIRDTATVQQITDGNLFFKNSIFHNNDNGNSPVDNWPTAQAAGDVDEMTIFTNNNADPGPAWGNRFQVGPGLSTTGMLSLTTPNWLPSDGSAALTGAATPESGGGFFDTTATYVGAFGTVDWTTGWTAYPQPLP